MRLYAFAWNADLVAIYGMCALLGYSSVAPVIGWNAVLGSGARIALRWPLEAHFELFWVLVARRALRWILEARFNVLGSGD